MLQTSVEKESQKVSSKLDNVIERIDALEKSHTSLETKVQMGSSCVPSTPTSSGTGKRKRQTPVALQVNLSPSYNKSSIMHDYVYRTRLEEFTVLSMKRSS